jgi:hypothetical protein
MAEKLAIYTASHGYPDADQYHIIVTGFGQMHEHSALIIKRWARLEAERFGRPVSSTNERSLERLGCAVLKGLGDNLEAFNRRCAPFPGPPGAAGALADDGNAGRSWQRFVAVVQGLAAGGGLSYM